MRRRNTQIVAAAEPQISAGREQHDARKLRLDHLRAAVGRGVIHDDDFGHGAAVVQRIQTFPQVFARIVIHNDNREGDQNWPCF